MRRDHVKAPPASQQFATVDEKLDVLTKDSHKMSFDQDCLKLTRDVAQLGCLYQEETKNSRSNRLQRVLHLKHQNRVGATTISKFMDLNIRLVGGRNNEQEAAAEKARSYQKSLNDNTPFIGFAVSSSYS